MPKRQDRLKPILHHKDSLEALKVLEPIATPEPWRDFSDTLFDIATEALGMAFALEAGRRPDPARYDRLVAQVIKLTDQVPRTRDDPENEYEIWSPAAENRGAICHGTATGTSFVEACRSHFEGDVAYSRDHHTYWDLPLFDNELAVRRWRGDRVGER